MYKCTITRRCEVHLCSGKKILLFPLSSNLQRDLLIIIFLCIGCFTLWILLWWLKAKHHWWRWRKHIHFVRKPTQSHLDELVYNLDYRTILVEKNTSNSVLISTAMCILPGTKLTRCCACTILWYNKVQWPHKPNPTSSGLGWVLSRSAINVPTFLLFLNLNNRKSTILWRLTSYHGVLCSYYGTLA